MKLNMIYLVLYRCVKLYTMFVIMNNLITYKIIIIYNLTHNYIYIYLYNIYIVQDWINQNTMKFNWIDLNTFRSKQKIHFHLPEPVWSDEINIEKVRQNFSGILSVQPKINDIKNIETSMKVAQLSLRKNIEYDSLIFIDKKISNNNRLAMIWNGHRSYYKNRYNS